MMHVILKRALRPNEFDDLVAEALKTPTAIGDAMLVADLFGVYRSPALTKFDRSILVIVSDSPREFDTQNPSHTACQWVASMQCAMPHMPHSSTNR
ncbi:MAG TPA: hypothetical protein VGI93_06245 [Steroidobacteraceae bacterium]